MVRFHRLSHWDWTGREKLAGTPERNGSIAFGVGSRQKASQNCSAKWGGQSSPQSAPVYHMKTPPSTLKAWPVMTEASSLAR